MPMLQMLDTLQFSLPLQISRAKKEEEEQESKSILS